MEIRLYDNCWQVNDEYWIEGNKEDGYQVFQNDLDECEIVKNVYFESKDFEECLVWCLNS